MKIICELNDQTVLGQSGRSERMPRLTARAVVRTEAGRYAVMYAEKFGLYTLPGGGMEDGEDAETALRRELREETGCDCLQITPLGRVLENRGSLDYTQDSWYYIVTVTAPGEAAELTAAERATGTTVQWLLLEEMLRRIALPEHDTVQRKYLQARDLAALRAYVAENHDVKEHLISEILEQELLFDEESLDGRLYARDFPEIWSAAQERLLETLLAHFGLSGAKAVPFLREEDGTAYAVWRVETPERTLVLKRAKAEELAIYQRFLKGYDFAPRFYGAVRQGNSDYFLMEHVTGTDLCKCDRPHQQAALDALIASQRPWWDSSDDYGYAAALQRRISRGSYLKDAALEAAYARFLELFRQTPRTLCHDDLLPFNVLVGERAVIMDWETAAMLPYPTPLARLIAHGTEDPADLFYMSAADRDFAIDYYYEQLIREQGISYEEFRRTLDYFLLFEFCEWIMLGNKYPDADMERFAQYSRLAKDLVQRLA